MDKFLNCIYLRSRLGLLFGFQSFFFILLLSVGLLVKESYGSIYPLDLNSNVASYERVEQMFGTNQGPSLGTNGISYIKINVEPNDVHTNMSGWRMVSMFYHASSMDIILQVRSNLIEYSCLPEVNFQMEGMSNLQRSFLFDGNSSSLTSGNAYYQVNSTGWNVVQLFVCFTNHRQNQVHLTGSVEIKNPYGYLPAMLYGLIPFSGLLTLGYLLLDIFFALLFFKHRNQVIRLQIGIFGVLAIGTISSFIWFLSFIVMNIDGHPLCCPYPPMYLIAVLLDQFTRTLARVLLLCVSLGFCVIRPRLRCREWMFISILAVIYFVSGCIDQIYRGQEDRGNIHLQGTYWSFIQMVCNLIFVVWIYIALDGITKALDEANQSAKLTMYQCLTYTLAGFVVFFSFFTMVVVSSHLKIFTWPFEWEWLQLIAWPVLNFTVAAAMCFIWRPTKLSSQYAYSKQLPMSDEAADELDKGREIEMTANLSPKFVIGDEEEHSPLQRRVTHISVADENVITTNENVNTTNENVNTTNENVNTTKDNVTITKDNVQEEKEEEKNETKESDEEVEIDISSDNMEEIILFSDNHIQDENKEKTFC